MALFPAYSLGEIKLACGKARSLIIAGCKEVCCIGPLAEQLEDEIDEIIESMERFEVATTSFIDETEGFEYFIFAANGGASQLLVAFLEGDREAEESLKKIIEKHN